LETLQRKRGPNTSAINRHRSQYRQRWKSDNDNLDSLDLSILQCIGQKPGISIVGAWRCLSKRLEPPRMHVMHYRIKTLETAGLIETKRIGNERKCWIRSQDQKEEGC
jgi:predicted transcriptional regulator